MKRRSCCRIVHITVILCCIFFQSQARAETAREHLTIGYVPLVSQLPLVVSYDNDRINFTKVQLRLVKYTSYTSLEAALRVGAIDIADLPLPVAFDMAGDGAAIRLLGQCHAGGSVLEAMGQSQFPDLRGKIIGVPGLRSNENLDLIQGLSEEKLRYGLDYKTIKVPYTNVLQYLWTKRIHAMYFPEPYGTLAEGNIHAVEVKKPGDNLSTGLTTVLCIRSEFLQQDRYRDALAELIQSLARACEFIENDINNLSAEQVAIIQEPYFGFARKVVSSSLVKRRGGIRFSLETPDKNMLKRYLRQALDANILVKPVDIDAFVAFSVFAQQHGGPPVR